MSEALVEECGQAAFASAVERTFIEKEVDINGPHVDSHQQSHVWFRYTERETVWH